MKNKTSKKTKLIIFLIVLISLSVILPIEEIIKRPAIVGHVVSKVFVGGLITSYNCTAVFQEGFNLISIPCIIQNNSVDSVLSSISDNYISIHSFDSTDKSDPWKTYNPNLPSWAVLDLNTISEKKGYWINMINQSNFNLNGSTELPNLITLSKGWNLIGYPTNATKNITLALATISGNYNLVRLYNASNGMYYYYNATAGNGTLQDMIQYYGYWINMSSDDVLLIT